MAFGFFDASKGEKPYSATPESIARQREIVAALMGNLTRAPRNIGEGLHALGQGLMIRGQRKRADKAEEAGLERRSGNSEQIMAALFGGGRGGYTPTADSAPKGSSPDVVAALTPQGTNKRKAGASPEQSEFIAQMWPLAQDAAKATGLDPRLIMGQAALETGWGKSAPGNNYFGIKSHGQPGGNVMATNEVVNGQTMPTEASFRSYAGPAESAQDYASFVQENPRYQPMLEAEGLDGQLRALGESGYATDPNYAGKVAQIAYGLDVPGQTYGMEGGQPPQGGPQMAQAGGGAPPMPQQSGPDPAEMQALMQLYNDPWTSEADKKLIGTYLEQQMQAMAPGYNLIPQGEARRMGLPDGVYQRDPEGRIVPISGAGDSALDRKVEALMSTGLDNTTATNIAAGRWRLDRHPVSGVAQVVDMATGQVIGQPSQGVPQQAGGSQPQEGFGVSDTSVPSDVDYGSALGAEGFVSNIANTVADAIGMDLPAPQAERASQALRNLQVRTQTMLQDAVPGRPSNYLLERIDKLTVEPSSVFQGEARAYERLQQTRDLIRRGLEEIDAILRDPGGYKPDAVSKARVSRNQLQSLLRDYETIIGTMEERGAASPQGGQSGPNEGGWHQTPGGVRYRIEQ